MKGDLSKIGTRQENFAKGEDRDQARPFENQERRQQFGVRDTFCDHKSPTLSSFDRQRLDDRESSCRCETRTNYKRFTGREATIEKQKLFEDMRRLENLRRRQHFDDCERFGDCQWQRASSYNRQRFSDHCQDSHRSAENMNKCDGAKKFDRESTFGPETLADFEDMRRLENLRRRQQYEDYDRFGDRRWQRTSSFGRPRFADDCHDSGRSEKHTERCGDSQRDSAFEARKFPDYEDMRRFRT